MKMKRLSIFMSFSNNENAVIFERLRNQLKKEWIQVNCKCWKRQRSDVKGTLRQKTTTFGDDHVAQFFMLFLVVFDFNYIASD